MAITATSTFDVTDQTPTTVSASTVVQAPVGFGTGGRGRLVHPTLGSYDYANTPSQIENVDGDICVPALWSHATTLGGGVDALWSGFVRDALVTERWGSTQVYGTEVGCTMAQLRQLWQFFANPPDPSTGAFVVWSPNYINGNSYNVAIVAVTAGGKGYTLDVRLAGQGYAPNPVEMQLRILGRAA